ncbi:MAG TPA: imidazole glycerol phosphate synthase subunit HisH [Xanthomonadaceae bacterium]|nr:imidazole glycerol phosphate synthase subunit HisH [Xanthomonadaceae bacterium]
MTAVALVDTGAANLASVRHALERHGAAVRLARDADDLKHAPRALLPGVGAAAATMVRLRERGLVEALRTFDRPLLGICLGMQLLHEWSEEGGVAGLGVLPGRVRALRPRTAARVPHMGWNALRIRRDTPWLAGVRDGDHAYFVHGFAVEAGPDCVAACTHGDVFAAVVARGAVAGTQFHPERSGTAGARVLANFLGLRA